MTLTSSFAVDHHWVLMSENEPLADFLRTFCGPPRLLPQGRVKVRMPGLSCALAWCSCRLEGVGDRGGMPCGGALGGGDVGVPVQAREVGGGVAQRCHDLRSVPGSN